MYPISGLMSAKILFTQVTHNAKESVKIFTVATALAMLIYKQAHYEALKMKRQTSKKENY